MSHTFGFYTQCWSEHLQPFVIFLLNSSLSFSQNHLPPSTPRTQGETQPWCEFCSLVMGFGRETRDWGQGIDRPVGRVNFTGCTHTTEKAWCFLPRLLASRFYNPEAFTWNGGNYWAKQLAHWRPQWEGRVFSLLQVVCRTSSLSVSQPCVQEDRSFTLCHCPLQHQMTANTPCTACSSVARQRSLQALLSSPSSPGLLCHMLSLSEDQIQVCSWIQSKFGASLDNVGEREEERKCQMLEHRVGSHRYRGEFGWKKGPTTGHIWTWWHGNFLKGYSPRRGSEADTFNFSVKVA